jgi:hypothetical protein
MSETPSVIVHPNQIPLGFENQFFTDDEQSAIKRIGKVRFPRIGAFEVFFGRK